MTDATHISHCFDYIRQVSKAAPLESFLRPLHRITLEQGVMCAGDTSLEKAIDLNGTRKPGFNGWGISHKCRDWRTIYQFAQRHRASDDTGIA